MSRPTGGRYRAPRGVFFGRGGFRRPLDDIEDDENNDSPSFDGYGLQQHRYVNPDEQDEEDEEEVDEVEETEEDDEYEEEAEEEEDEEVETEAMAIPVDRTEAPLFPPMTIVDESEDQFLVDVQLATGSTSISLPKTLLHKMKSGIYKIRLSDTTTIMSVLQAAIERDNKANRAMKRKAESEQPPTNPKQPKSTTEKVPETKTPETPVVDKTEEDSKKKPKPLSTSKGLSTQKTVIEKHIRQAASSVLATINPSVPLSLEEKRAKLAELKKVGAAEPVKEASPEEVRFLTHVFQNTRKDWPAGLEDMLLLLHVPPTIEESVASDEDPSKTVKVRTFGPVPKLDPDFLVPALNGYSAIKASTNQVMTTFDHHFRAWMQHVLAVAVGLAPCLGMELPTIDDLPVKELEKSMPDGTTTKIPNPEYIPAMVKFAEDMQTWIPKMQLRMGAATDAAEGLNVLYENIRHQRALNFINEFKPKTQYRRIGLLESNRFGEYLFDNDKEKILSRLKKQGEVYYENKAATTGMPKTQLMRQDKWPLAEKGIHEGGKNDYGRQQQPSRNNQGSGNFRGPQRGFRGGGRPKPRGKGFKNGRGSHFQTTNTHQWHENAQDQPGPSGQNNNNRGKPKNKRQWGGGGRGGGNQ